MRNYEALYIVKPQLSDSDAAQLAAHFKGVVEGLGGTVSKAEKWDRRKLAYEIKGYTEGVYILMEFAAPPSVPAELSRLLRIHDDVIRHRIFSQED
ncbi:MAG: 30S ribosomal protein S6 [Fimbriimonadales bacterium]|nr:30S ribosomal protein S6 [Fimbriimonadales bacterium]